MKKKVSKKVTKKVTKKAGVTMTVKQAQQLKDALAKAGKSYKWLDKKLAEA